MGLFLLLTLYGAIRARSAPRLWAVAAVAACALGMASKEAMVVAPLIVLAWDWLFASPPGQSFRPVWQSRWPLYAALAATWFVLVVNGWHAPRAASAGFGFDEWPWWRYLATQAGVILHYLRLSVVPAPLVLDYGWPAVESVADALPAIVLVSTLVVVTAIGVLKRHPLAFGGVVFFLALAPTSSVLPIVTEVAAEHRMYVPLAAVLGVLVPALVWRNRPAGWTVVGLAVVACAVTTAARQADYWSLDCRSNFLNVANCGVQTVV
jgi:hypothetical protein